jgi:hypothetical protein
MMLRFVAIIRVNDGFMEGNAANKADRETARSRKEANSAGKRGYSEKGR